MMRITYCKVILSFLYVVIGVHLFTTHVIHAELTSLAKNDPYPLYSTLNLDERFLLTKEQLTYKDDELAEKRKNHVNLCITPFGQNASRGKSIKGQPCPILFTGTVPPCPDAVDTPLGDLTGRSGMLPLLYGAFPDGVTTYPGGTTGSLFKAYQAFYSGTPPAGQVNNGGDIDPAQLFGYFSFPLEYRKRGLRVELDALFHDNFGLRVQAGFSSIRQVVENIINETNNIADTFVPVTETITGGPNNPNGTIDIYLMDQLNNIAQQIGINIGDLIQTSAEEVRFNLFWRQIFDMNDDEGHSWTHFLLIPYFEAGGSFSPGKARNPNQLFAVPFGNNSHSSVGFTTGINFDFVETIEIGGEIGFTHFFKKHFCNYPMPNSQFQTTIFPFKAAAVSISPGNNWYFGGRIAAYHFLGNLSMFFEWFVLDHKQDSITITSSNTNSAFLPGVLEETTTFKVKFGNAGFNYDIAPNVGLGFLWQIPFSQRNTYRSSTIMAGINFTF